MEQRHEITKKPVVYTMAGTDAVTVQRDEVYRAPEAGALGMDLYRPPEASRRLPAVVFVIGFPDGGTRKILGCAAREMESYVSWARLVAASGMAAVTYTNREPAADLSALWQHLRQNAGSLGIDASRIGIWACSGHGPLALSLLMHGRVERPRCAAFCYPYTLDLDGSTAVAEASRQWGFVNACAGRPLDELASDVPFFIARAGADEMPGLNDALDRFVARALPRNLPLTVVNHPSAPHAFDLFDAGEASREIIRQVLAFFRHHLL